MSLEESPEKFLSYISWSPKGPEYSEVSVPNIESYLSPFLTAPEWLKTNFYLLKIPSFRYNGISHFSITQEKIFELIKWYNKKNIGTDIMKEIKGH